MENALDKLVLDINDCAYPLVRDAVVTLEEADAFKKIDAAFLVGPIPRREGMERKEILKKNFEVR